MATTDERLERIEALLRDVPVIKQMLLDLRTEMVNRFDLADQLARLNHEILSARLGHEQIANAHNAKDINQRMTALEEKVAKLINPAA